MAATWVRKAAISWAPLRSSAVSPNNRPARKLSSAFPAKSHPQLMAVTNLAQPPQLVGILPDQGQQAVKRQVQRAFRDMVGCEGSRDRG